jgi:hypothetical protein
MIKYLLTVAFLLALFAGCQTAPDGYEDDWTPDHEDRL